MTVDTAQRPTGSVVIIGAGTQGRRLAFMVSEGLEIQHFRIKVNWMKWSGRGGSVCLVDLQNQQLQDGLSYVSQLRRNAAVEHERNWGEVTVAHPESLKSVLQDAWLVVEVIYSNLNFDAW
jgi:hypothetical protein